MFTLVWSLVSIYIPLFPVWLTILIAALLLCFDVLIIWRLIK